MRILHIFDHSAPCASSYSRRITAILRHQRLQGWKTMHMTGPGHPMAAPAAPARLERLLQPASAQWQFFRTPPADRASDRLPVVGAINLVARRLQQVVQMTRPQLLHVHSPIELAFAALRVGRRQGLPVVFEPHAPAPFSPDGASWMPPGRKRGPVFPLAPTSSGLARLGMRALEVMAAQRAAAVVTNSDGMCARLRAGGVSPARLHLVPDGVEPLRYAPPLDSCGNWHPGRAAGVVRDRRAGSFNPRPASVPERRGPHRKAPPRPFLLGFAPASNEEGGGGSGSVAALKLLFRAMGMLETAGLVVQLIVACDASEDKTLRELARLHGVGARVASVLADPGAALDRVGWAPSPVRAEAVAVKSGWAIPVKPAEGSSGRPCQSRIAALHARADIVVFPQAATNHAAAPPRQLLEAMARGCVIAAVRSPEHEAVIEHGRDGVLFAPEDAGALADALRVLLEGTGRWPGMRISARWFIDYHRSWEACVSLYKPVYEELIGRRGR